MYNAQSHPVAANQHFSLVCSQFLSLKRFLVFMQHQLNMLSPIEVKLVSYSLSFNSK